MKIAFLIEAHNDVEHLQKLVNALKGHNVFIHWDAKSGMQPHIEGATFTTKRISVFWAGFSQVEATMELIKTALESGEIYDKYVLLSGAYYPIKPIKALETLFANDGGKNYLKAIKVADADFLMEQVNKKIWRDAILPESIERIDSLQKIERILRFGLNLILRFFNKKKINMEIYHGSNWWALNHETVKYIVEIYNNRPDIIDFFKFTFASDEKFFHTIIRNSLYGKYCEEYSQYTGRGTYKMANLHIIDPSLSRWFTEQDYVQIQSSDKFFVRKLRTKDTDSLTQKIDLELLGDEVAR